MPSGGRTRDDRQPQTGLTKISGGSGLQPAAPVPCRQPVRECLDDVWHRWIVLHPQRLPMHPRTGRQAQEQASGGRPQPVVRHATGIKHAMACRMRRTAMAHGPAWRLPAFRRMHPDAAGSRHHTRRGCRTAAVLDAGGHNRSLTTPRLRDAAHTSLTSGLA